MTVLIVYVLLVGVLLTIVTFVGITIDTMVPNGWDLIIAMAMFFGVIWSMWPVSVFITERWFDSGSKHAKPARGAVPVE